MKWTFDQSQLKSFCILQLSGDPFKSAKSRPASGLSPRQDQEVSLKMLKFFLKQFKFNMFFPTECECYSEGNNNIFSLTGMQCLDITLWYIYHLLFSVKKENRKLYLTYSLKERKKIKSIFV